MGDGSPLLSGVVIQFCDRAEDQTQLKSTILHFSPGFPAFSVGVHRISGNELSGWGKHLLRSWLLESMVIRHKKLRAEKCNFCRFQALSTYSRHFFHIYMSTVLLYR